MASWTEHFIASVAGISDLLKEKTVILITHRPASVARADRVVKMENLKVLPGTVF